MIQVRFIKQDKVLEILGAALILLYIYAASSKLLNIQQSYFEMSRQPFPNWLHPILTWAVPIVELLVAGLLLSKRTRLVGFHASLWLMSAFTIYIALGLLKVFNRMPCSCGGVLKNMTWKQHLIFNVVFLLISLGAILIANKAAKVSPETNVAFI